MPLPPVIDPFGAIVESIRKSRGQQSLLEIQTRIKDSLYFVHIVWDISKKKEGKTNMQKLQEAKEMITEVVKMVPINSTKAKSQTSLNTPDSQLSTGTFGGTTTLSLPNNGMFAWMRVFRLANLLTQAGC